tara:strand:- start:196 stop:465 length:270 start_codon:yes stop_codon:yes gene_type:complete
MKITALIYGIIIFYLLGRYSKIPSNFITMIWLFSFGGCIFLWAGLYLNNFQFIKGGFFIMSILGLIFIHQIVIKYHLNKQKVHEKINLK